MEQFFSNLWGNVKNAYFKVRNFLARHLNKALSYALAMSKTVQIKQLLGQEVTFMDYVRTVTGNVLEIGICVVFGLTVSLASYFVEMALATLTGGLVALVVLMVLRIAFIMDVFDEVQEMRVREFHKLHAEAKAPVEAEPVAA